MPVRTTAAAITIESTTTTTAPCRTRRGARKPPGKPPIAAAAKEQPRQYIEPGSSERATVLQAIALINRVIDLPNDQFIAAHTRDSEGYMQLSRARGALVRALATPADRDRELAAAQRDVLRPEANFGVYGLDVARMARAQLLEAWDHLGGDYTPGSFYMPDEAADALNRIGTDPEVLR